MSRGPKANWALLDAHQCRQQRQRRREIALILENRRKEVAARRDLLAKTLKRKPDADDRKEIALLVQQGYEASFIGSALTLDADIVREVISKS